MKITYQDVLDFLTEQHTNIESELDNIHISQTEKIKRLKPRSERILDAIRTLELERDYYERGACMTCGDLASGITKGKTYCGFHGMELEA